MPEVDITTYANLPTADLEQKRSALIAKAKGNPDNLTDDDLRELSIVTGVLRRKASGPPKAAPKPRGKQKVELSDLA